MLELGLQGLQGAAVIEEFIGVAIQTRERLMGVKIVVGLLRGFM